MSDTPYSRSMVVPEASFSSSTGVMKIRVVVTSGETLSYTVDGVSTTLTGTGSEQTISASPSSGTFLFSSATALLSIDMTGVSQSTFSFSGCTSLTSARISSVSSSVSSIDLSEAFSGCTSLVTVDLLGIDEEKVTSISKLFYGCVSFTTLKNFDLSRLSSCSSLAYAFYNTKISSFDLKQLFDLPFTAINYLLYGCSSLTDTGLTGMMAGGDYGLPSSASFEEHDYDSDPLMILSHSSSAITITFTATGTPSSITLLSSDDGETWTENTYSTTFTFSIAAYSVLYLKTTTTELSTSSGDYWTISSSGAYSLSGNICALIGYETDVPLYCFYKLFYSSTNLLSPPSFSTTAVKCGAYSCYQMFYGCTSLKWAPDIPFSTIGNYAFYQMFYGCQSITRGPRVLSFATAPASCCYEMFRNCSSLTAAPSFLSLKTLQANCFYRMFYSCSSLERAMPIIPGTTQISYSCYQMFYGCSSLKYPPLLPATTLGRYCYAGMFYGCTSLAVVPALPATETATYCYCQMFYGCTSLKKSGELPATTLTASCYDSMFSGCTSLTDGPSIIDAATAPASSCYKMFSDCSSLIVAPRKITATTAKEKSFYQMFSGCSSLVVAPELSLTTVGTSSCYQMFSKCTSLVVAPPSLPALSLSATSYYGMFQNCSSLRVAPTVLATSSETTSMQYMFTNCTNLVEAPVIHGCYLIALRYAFSGCSSLRHVTCLSNLIGEATSWLSGVPEGGTITPLPGTESLWSAVGNLPDTWSYSYKEIPLCFYSDTAQTLTFTLTGSGSFSYRTSTDLITWTDDVTASATFTLSLSAATPLYIEGDNSAIGSSSSSYWTVSATASFGAYGNILSLIDYSKNVPDYCFYKFFSSCTYLTHTPAIPAFSVGAHSFDSCFESCTAITEAPDLPAMRLSEFCYSGMFYKCSALTTPMEILPAYTLAKACYNGMFDACSALTIAPILPAKILAERSYDHMLRDCTSLSEVTVLCTVMTASSCLSNFLSGVSESESSTLYYDSRADVDDITEAGGSGWTQTTKMPLDCLIFTNNGSSSADISLTKVGSPASITIYTSSDGETWVNPTISSTVTWTIAAGGQRVFWSSNSTISASTSSYWKFSSTSELSCSGNLLSLINYADTIPAYCFYCLFYNFTTLVSAPDIIASLTNNYCCCQMFNGCTSLETPPPSLGIEEGTIGQRSCSQMFYGCTSLWKAPYLPASTYNANACYAMFWNCSSLEYTPENELTTLSGSNALQYMFRGAKSLSHAFDLSGVSTMSTSGASALYYSCTSLIDAGDLSGITTLATSCFYNCFYGCVSLAVAPALPDVSTLVTSCYNSMFYGCSSLREAPTFPSSITCAEKCCRQMFYNCSTLSAGPSISVSSFSSSCFTSLFSGCGRLKSLSFVYDGTSTDVESFAESWIDSSSSGLLTTTSSTYHQIEDADIPSFWGVSFTDYTSVDSDSKDCLVFTNESGTDGVITIVKTGSPPPIESLVIGYEGECWGQRGPLSDTCGFFLPAFSSVSITTDSTSLSRSGGSYWTFSSDVPYSVTGDLSSLVAPSNDGFYDYYPPGTFYGLFENDPLLLSSPSCASATYLKGGVLERAFAGCSSLYATGAITATLAGPSALEGVYQDCVSLTEEPSITIDTAGPRCYAYYLKGCAGIEEATVTASSFTHESLYGAFMDCDRLKKVTVSFSTPPFEDTCYYWLSGTPSGLYVEKPSRGYEITKSSALSLYNLSYQSTLRDIDLSQVVFSGTLSSVQHAFCGSGVKSLLFSGATAKVTDASGFCHSSSALLALNINSSGVTVTGSMNQAFASCAKVEEIGLSWQDISAPSVLTSLFASDSALTTIHLEGWKMNSSAIYTSMFSSCSSLSKIYIYGCGADTLTILCGALAAASLSYAIAVDADGMGPYISVG